MNETEKKIILEAVSKMLDEGAYVSMQKKLNESWGPGFNPGPPSVSSRGMVIIIESGLPEAIPLLNRHDFVVSR